MNSLRVSLQFFGHEFLDFSGGAYFMVGFVGVHCKCDFGCIKVFSV